MSARIFVPALIAAFLLAAPPTAMANEELPPPGSTEYQKARAEFYDSLRGFDDNTSRVFRIGEIAFIERPGGLRQALAERAFEAEFGSAPQALYRLFYMGDAEVKKRILRLWRAHWNTLGRGTSTARTEMVRHALRHEDPSLRRVAANLAAEFSFRYIGHAIVDAATDDESLVLPALLALRNNREWQNTRWAMEMLDSDQDDVVAAAKHALAAIGPRGKQFVTPATTSEDPAERARAVRALLTMASNEDLSVLFRWLSEDGEDDPKLAEEVTRALAQLESGIYRPELPRLPRIGVEAPAS